MDELWELPPNIQAYVYDNSVPMQLYSSPIGDAFDGLEPEVGIATAIVHNDAEEILFINHSESGRYWELPSGHIEAGENPENAVRREVREETGYLLTDVVPICLVVWPFEDTVRVQMVFGGRVGDKVSHGDGEAEEISWRDGVPDNVTFGDLGKDMYEYYISESRGDESDSYFKQGLAVLGVGLSAVAFKGVQKYREARKESDEDEENGK